MGLTIPVKTDSTMLDLIRAAYPVIVKSGKDMTNLAQTYQNYLSSEWFRSDRKKVSDGTYVTWPIIHRTLNNVRHVQLYDEDSVTNQDVTIQGHAQWTHLTWSIAYDRRELDMVSSNPQKLYELLSARRAATQMAAWDQLEADLFGNPTTDSEVQTVPQGIPHWIQRNASGTGDWIGADPAGITGGCGGLLTTDYALWKNWAALYTTITAADLIKTMRRTVEKLNFSMPAVHAEDVPDEGKFLPSILLGTEVKLSLEDVAAGQNDQLGFALDATRDKATFYGVPITKVAALDTSTWTAINPVYFVDKATFKVYVLKNNDFRETPPTARDSAHNVYSAHMDVSFQYVCTNRKRNGIISLT